MRRLTMALAIVIGSLAGGSAQAAITFNIDSTEDSLIRFVGDGTTATIDFYNTLGPVDTFEITTVFGGTGSAVGLTGTISGNFTYTTADIVNIGGGVQRASLTSNGTVLSIDDGTNVLTADINGVDITSVGASGTINFSAAINLTNVSYAGTNADLVTFSNLVASSGGTAVLTYQFATNKTLTQLKNQALNETSFSGTLTATPEPSTLAMAFTGIALAGVGVVRRRRTKA